MRHSPWPTSSHDLGGPADGSQHGCIRRWWRAKNWLACIVRNTRRSMVMKCIAEREGCQRVRYPHSRASAFHFATAAATASAAAIASAVANAPAAAMGTAAALACAAALASAAAMATAVAFANCSRVCEAQRSPPRPPPPWHPPRVAMASAAAPASNARRSRAPRRTFARPRLPPSPEPLPRRAFGAVASPQPHSSSHLRATWRRRREDMGGAIRGNTIGCSVAKRRRILLSDDRARPAD